MLNEEAGIHPQQENGECAAFNRDDPSKRVALGVLVVDDEFHIRALLQTGLERRGVKVWQAAGGVGAVRLYTYNYSYLSVLLLNIRMASLDGPQTLAALLFVNP